MNERLTAFADGGSSEPQEAQEPDFAALKVHMRDKFIRDRREPLSPGQRVAAGGGRGKPGIFFVPSKTGDRDIIGVSVPITGPDGKQAGRRTDEVFVDPHGGVTITSTESMPGQASVVTRYDRDMVQPLGQGNPDWLTDAAGALQHRTEVFAAIEGAMAAPQTGAVIGLGGTAMMNTGAAH